MHTDLKRICGKGNYSSIQANFPEFNEVYAVILADYWKKKKWRLQRHCFFME